MPSRTAALADHSEISLSFLELHAVKIPGRYHQALQEFQHTLMANNALVADTVVDEAPEAFFNKKYRLEYSSQQATLCREVVCHYFPEYGTRSQRALQGWRRSTPARSRDPHAWCVWATLILEFLRHGHWSMGIYLFWMVTCYFRPGEPLTILRRDIQVPIQGISPQFQVLLHPEDRPLRSKTYAANDTVELFCPWCESLPLTAAALAQRHPTERAFNFRYHDFLLEWNKMTEAAKLETSSSPWCLTWPDTAGLPSTLLLVLAH